MSFDGNFLFLQKTKKNNTFEYLQVIKCSITFICSKILDKKCQKTDWGQIFHKKKVTHKKHKSFVVQMYDILLWNMNKKIRNIM